jgi:hypothetical protein
MDPKGPAALSRRISHWVKRMDALASRHGWKESQLLLLGGLLLCDLLHGFLSCLFLGHGISSVLRFTPLFRLRSNIDREQASGIGTETKQVSFVRCDSFASHP